MTNARLLTVARYASLLGGGVFAGVALTVLIVELALRRLGASAYVQVRHAEYEFMVWFIGVVFLPTLIAVVALVILTRKAHSPAFAPAAGALALVLVALVITFAVNGPINIEQLGWSARFPPADWASVRDRWQVAHAIRTAASVLALGCLTAAFTRSAR